MFRLLIADPSAKNADTIVQKFRKTISVKFCTDGNSFHEIMHEFEPEYLILDLHMPNIDGLTLLRDIRAAGNMIPVIVLSACLPDFIQIQLHYLGMTISMLKPVSLEHLIDQIAKLDRSSFEAPPWSVECELDYILVRLGFKVGPTRYSYVRYANLMRFEHETISLTKELYPTVSNRVNGGITCVEKCIRDAVRYARNHGDHGVWKAFFPALKPGEIPKNEEFLGRIALALRNRERPRKALEEISTNSANVDAASL